MESLEPEIINYRKKSAFQLVMHDMDLDGYVFKVFEEEESGETEAIIYATEMGAQYIYYCEELNQYFIFYRS